MERYGYRLVGFALLGLLGIALSACSGQKEMQTGALTRHLVMVGDDGKRYGSVEMDPIGGGKVLDASGNLIATLTPAYAQQAYAAPAQAQPAIAPMPVVTGYAPGM